MKSAISEILEAPERRFMSRALDLANQPQNSVLPNPRVGAVIVKNNQIVGEGFHEGPGRLHAEAVAIRAAESSGIQDFSDCDLYVNLEPCSHLNKRTPPCAPLVAEKKFRSVFVATLDPNPLVSGRGVSFLERAGIPTHVGLCDSEAQELNQAFFKNQTQRLPYLTLKVATTFDGRLADDFGQSQWITGPKAREVVHEMRAHCDAIAVGAKTFDQDNPSLNARLSSATYPKKVVIFGSPERDWKSSKACEANGDDALITLDSQKPISSHLKTLFDEHHIHHLFVEGGRHLASRLLAEEVVDELILFFGRGFVGGRGEYGLLGSSFATKLDAALPFQPTEVKLIGSDVMCRGRLHVYGID